MTKETPKQILTADYPECKWPISGGWGYSMDDAVVVELGDELSGVDIEYVFLRARTFEEAVKFRPQGQQLGGFQFETKMQSLLNGDNGKSYDLIVMSVTALLQSDFEYLRNEWKSHNAYKDDEVGKAMFLQLFESKKIRYEVGCFFDITRFFGE